VKASIKEFENYVQTHPDAAAELRAIQEVRDKGRFRKGGAKLKRTWRTLPDEYNPCDFGMLPCWVIWETPGKGRGGGGGGEYPPRTILVGDDSAEGCDPRQPQRNCLRRALSIISLFREGGRCLQVGFMEHGDPNCELLRSLNKQNRRTIAVIEDIKTNGVPASPHGPACTLTEQEKQALDAVKGDLERQIKDNCKKAREKNCQPMPEGC